MRRNIKLLYAFRVIKYFLLIMPIIVPFFQEKGLSHTQIFLLESVVAGSIMLCELPSGYFADKFGRKKSILIGSILACIAYLIYCLDLNFYSLIIANTIMGFGYSFISGADSALAYESFKILNQEERYLKYESRVVSATAFSQVLASLAGGALAVLSLKYAVIGQVIAYLFLTPCALLLTETPHLKPLSPPSIKDLFKTTQEVFLKKNNIKWLILYFSLVGNMTHTVIWITQPLYQDLGLALKWFGALWALQYLILAIFSRYSYKLANLFGTKTSLILMASIGLASYFMIYFTHNYFSLVIILLLYVVRGVFKPIIVQAINGTVESEVRATVFSLENFIKKFFYMIIGPVIGLSADIFSINTSFLVSGVIYSILSILVIKKISSIDLK